MSRFAHEQRGSDAEDGSQAFVDVVNQYLGQPAGLLSQERLLATTARNAPSAPTLPLLRFVIRKLGVSQQLLGETHRRVGSGVMAKAESATPLTWTRGS